MIWQMEHLFEIKLKQEQHFFIPLPFVHLWHMVFVYVLSRGSTVRVKMPQAFLFYFKSSLL